MARESFCTGGRKEGGRGSEGWAVNVLCVYISVRLDLRSTVFAVFLEQSPKNSGDLE